MKTSFGITLSALAAAALFVSGAALAHDGIETKLRPYQETPSVSSTAKGKFSATISELGDSIAYELSYSALEGDVRQAHIHFGQRGVAGGISIWLCQTSFNVDPTGLSPTCPGPREGTVSGTLRAAGVVGPAAQGIAAGEFAELVAAIRAGVAYANVHSTKFPGGEIRGQLKDD
jgi:hypothetical protein